MPKNSKHDAALEKEIKDSLKTSSYLNNIYDSITTGAPVDSAVPDYSGGMAKTGGMKSGGSTSNESGMLPGIMLATDALFQAAAGAVGSQVAPTASAPESAPMTKVASAPQPEYSVSPRQWKALEKYPSLIEFLGGSSGDDIASEILAKVNGLMVKQLEKNAKTVSKYADSCVADSQNLKQRYVGENKEWVCQVIASGPFRGDETIYYDNDKDKSMVLRRNGQQFTNVSGDFNIIHEFVQTKVSESKQIDEMPGIVTIEE